MEDGVTSVVCIVTLSSSYHSAGLQRSGGIARLLLGKNWLWDFPAPVSGDERVMVIPEDGGTCVYTSEFTHVYMYSYVCRFMCMHPYLSGCLCMGAHVYVYLFVYTYMCRHVHVHMEAMSNLRCHFRTLSILGFETEPLTGPELTY